MIKVSVIIPVYNVEAYLSRCLDSVINQTLKEIEIIIINDGSTDNSYKIIKDYEKKDCRIKTISQNNGGLSMARNAGLEIATGEYIGFVDSDDRIDERMYEVMYAEAKKNDADIVGCNYCDEYDDKTITKPLYKFKDLNIKLREYGLDKFIREIFLPYSYGCEVWSKIFRNEIINKNNIRFEKNNEIFAEDWLFDFYYFMKCNKIILIDEAFYYHFIRIGSIMNADKPKLTQRLMELINRFEKKSKINNQYAEIYSVIPDITYSLVTFSIYYHKNFKTKWKALKSAYMDNKFITRMKEFYENKNNSKYRRIFAWLVINKFITLAITYRMIIEKRSKINEEK